MAKDTTFARTFRKMSAPRLMRHFGEGQTPDEKLLYRKSGGTSRPIEAIVNRNGIQTIGDDGQVRVHGLVVAVMNQTQKGFTSAEVDTGTDEIFVARRVGESPSWRQVVEIVDDTGGMVSVAVQ